jgi:hypothetical protein
MSGGQDEASQQINEPRIDPRLIENEAEYRGKKILAYGGDGISAEFIAYDAKAGLIVICDTHGQYVGVRNARPIEVTYCTPTDADAIANPRMECEVRDREDEEWKPAKLLAVVGEQFIYRYISLLKIGHDRFRCCRIKKPSP